MSNTTRPTCSTCRFWVPIKGQYLEDGGACNRYPQQVAKTGTKFCGEHQPDAIEFIPAGLNAEPGGVMMSGSSEPGSPAAGKRRK